MTSWQILPWFQARKSWLELIGAQRASSHVHGCGDPWTLVTHSSPDKRPRRCETHLPFRYASQCIPADLCAIVPPAPFGHSAAVVTTSQQFSELLRPSFDSPQYFQPAAMVGPTASRIMDRLHQATVGVLVLSTVYFGVEAFRATWYIQKYKAEQRVSV